MECLKGALEREGIPVRILALDPKRPNLLARLKGVGRRRPLLIMGHTDVVNVDPRKWKFPPFSDTLDAGYVYGRGTVDDKDEVTACLMAMLTLKRLNVALDEAELHRFARSQWDVVVSLSAAAVTAGTIFCSR